MEKTVRRKWWRLSGLIFLLVVAYVIWSVTRPLPQLRPDLGLTSLKINAGSSSLAWPAAGQSAVGIAGSDILDVHGSQKPVPTASTAKVITALMVLRQKPLVAGQQGPTVTLTANDKAIFDAYSAQGGSVVPVQAGEQISEYQMLEAMLLPSANNMADSLAVWAYGSLPAYTAAANTYLHQLGLAGTTVGSDASGYAPSTLSTAHDLVRLGELAMQNPVLAGIVSQGTASGIPLVSTVKNVNFLLGTSGIVGIKTGNTDQAGGVYISASRITINQKPLIIITALAGSPSLWQSLHDSLPLIQSAQANFKPVTVVQGGSVLGTYHEPWGGSVPAVASQSLSLQTWNGSSLTTKIQLPPLKSNAKASQIVGIFTVPSSITSDRKSVDIKLVAGPAKPTIRWRLLHP